MNTNTLDQQVFLMVRDFLRQERSPLVVRLRRGKGEARTSNRHMTSIANGLVHEVNQYLQGQGAIGRAQKTTYQHLDAAFSHHGYVPRSTYSYRKET